MADVILSWAPNPPEEQITGYAAFMDDAKVTPVQPPYTFEDVPMGVHVFKVSPIGPWGEGPESDPVTTPPGAHKPVLTIDIHIRMNS